MGDMALEHTEEVCDATVRNGEVDLGATSVELYRYRDIHARTSELILSVNVLTLLKADALLTVGMQPLYSGVAVWCGHSDCRLLTGHVGLALKHGGLSFKRNRYALKKSKRSAGRMKTIMLATLQKVVHDSHCGLHYVDVAGFQVAPSLRCSWSPWALRHYVEHIGKRKATSTPSSCDCRALPLAMHSTSDASNTYSLPSRSYVCLNAIPARRA